MKLIFFLFSLAALAQDERYFRKIYTGELKEFQGEAKEYKYVFSSPAYQLDLNDDGYFESILISKKDNIDFLEVRDYEGRQVFEHRLYAYGGDAHLYRLKKVKLSNHATALILFFYEGARHTHQFEATARLYFLTLDDKKLDSLRLFYGPNYWHEFEKFRETFWQRDLNVNVVDYNEDGTKEVSVTYNHISRVYFYRGQGTWLNFK
ncbi:MAG: hypothetical protein JNM93_07450 [Bacteriovoracaceae bacterium]|nr:hypothetical protein [Bacteriovoracaceae bacterium]